MRDDAIMVGCQLLDQFEPTVSINYQHHALPQSKTAMADDGRQKEKHVTPLKIRTTMDANHDSNLGRRRQRIRRSLPCVAISG